MKFVKNNNCENFLVSYMINCLQIKFFFGEDVRYLCFFFCVLFYFDFVLVYKFVIKEFCYYFDILIG